MSIVLNNAFRMQAATLEDAVACVHVWRARIQSMGIQDDNRLHAEMATTTIDRTATLVLRAGETTPVSQNPLGDASSDIKERRQNIITSGYRDTEVDFDFTVTLMSHSEGIRGLVHTEREAWARAFLASEGILSEPWWNNSDGDEDTPSHVWERRGDIWTEILSRDPYRRPAYCGLTLTLTPLLGSSKVSEIVDAQPGLDHRVREMATDAMRHDFLVKSGDLSDMTQVFSRLGRFDQYLRSESGRAALCVFKDACRDLMKEKLTQEDFLGGEFSVPKTLPPISK